jgi:hypothetical protein
LLGVEIAYPKKKFLGDETVPTRLVGTQQRADGWYTVERHDDLDRIRFRKLAGPFPTEQDAEREANKRVKPYAPELESLSAEAVGDMLDTAWKRRAQKIEANVPSQILEQAGKHRDRHAVRGVNKSPGDWL